MPKHKGARAPRSLPYARPDAAMETDEAAAPALSKKGKLLSTHMQKVIERKRLQAEIAEVKNQRRKVKNGSGSLGDKKKAKAAKKELSKQIHSTQQQRASLQSFVEAHRQVEPEAPAAPSEPAAPFQFNLPTRPMAVEKGFVASR
mmetsp:Transcript_27893/g.65394  ORF Transcript_27893/g.65394 Transcript_27893/m.65394 type:complete len:145 (+) Transcript_27893:177-611(+)|eukprot:CAMPEP_0179893262 /NCGR_PEP_ID=MMETSP0982-20121206/34684_1 /TAXON_ID=483367 /ORGANISM="non described non described, Strain CCMP 2436" /LENGTH=144 /DNA_ID=CAMNT_0021789825 /DNA_START=146 /DNA_END=580 /DNA_ORIENTATION=-